MFGSKTYDGQHSIRMRILRNEKSKNILLADETVTVHSVSRRKTYSILTKDEIPLKENTTYRIKLNINGPETFCGLDYLKRVQKDDLCVRFHYDQNPSLTDDEVDLERGIPALCGLVLRRKS